jgi:hypothetical protein
MVPGQAYRGIFETAFDRDAIGFAARAGVSYRVTVDAAVIEATFPSSGQRLWSTFPSATQVVSSPVDDTLFAIVRGGMRADTTFRVRLEELQDDLSPFPTPEARLELGVPRRARIDFSGDQDAFTLPAVAGQSYAVTVTPDPDATVSSFPQLYLPSGEVLNTVERGPGAAFRFTAGTTGDHGVTTTGLSATGGYTVLVEASPDLAGNAGTSGRIAVGQTVDGMFEDVNDRDWYAVDLVAGTSYAFTLDQAGRSLALHDAAERRISFTDAGDLTLPATVQETGRYFIGASAGQFGSGPYRLTAVETAETPANPTTPARLAEGETIAGTLTRRDADWFAATFAPDTTYRVTYTRPGRAETVLSIHDAAGRTRWEQMDDAGLPMLFSTGNAGARFVGIRDIEGAAGDYTLRYEAVADVGQTQANAVPLAPGAAWSGHLFRGDADMFALDAGPGDYTVTIASTGPGARPSLITLNAPSTVRDVDLGADAHRVALTVAEGAGPLYLLIADPDVPAPVRPFYTLQVTAATLGTAGDNRLTAPPGSVTHALEGDDTILGQDGGATILAGFGDDIVFAGSGGDTVFGGAGDDALHLGAGDDRGEGRAGDDLLVGNAGNDTLAGNAGADTLIGGPGDDVLNPGLGADAVRGGAGADRFWAEAAFSTSDGGARSRVDWIADYDHAEGDVLVWDDAAATPDQFEVIFGALGDAGQNGVAEAAIIHRPSGGHLIWVLVDGAAQDAIALQIGGQVFDLLA